MSNPDRLFKDEIFEQFARIGKAVSSPKRLELLELLSQGEQTVEVLAKKTNMTIANTSRHLRVLYSSRLVQTSKEGLYVKYRLAGEEVLKYLSALRALGEARLTEIQDVAKNYYKGREGMEPSDYDSLVKRINEGTVIVLDVRPVDEYKAGHIPGAIPMPLKELNQRLADLPKGQEIVAYCRGPYCVLAVKAVEILRAEGFDAVCLGHGVKEWSFCGYPVEKSNIK